MKQKQRKEKLQALKSWLKRKREDNLNMTVQELRVKTRRHKLAGKERDYKRQEVKYNRRRRLLLWKRRHRKKQRGIT